MSPAHLHPPADAHVGSARSASTHIAFAPEATCQTNGRPASTR
jgi:hypothetical protein